MPLALSQNCRRERDDFASSDVGDWRAILAGTTRLRRGRARIRRLLLYLAAALRAVDFARS